MGTRRDARVSLPLIVKALVLHALSEIGSLATHLFALGGSRVSEAALMEAAAKGGLADPLCLSFAKLHHGLEGIFEVAALAQAAGRLLGEEQLAGLWRALCAQLFGQRRKGPRRARSCPRAVRQPIKGWPRLLETHSRTGAALGEVRSIQAPKAAKKAASTQR